MAGPHLLFTFTVPAQLGLPTRWVLIFRLKTAIFDLEMSGFESLRLPAFMWGTQAREIVGKTYEQ